MMLESLSIRSHASPLVQYACVLYVLASLLSALALSSLLHRSPNANNSSNNGSSSANTATQTGTPGRRWAWTALTASLLAFSLCLAIGVVLEPPQSSPDGPLEGASDPATATAHWILLHAPVALQQMAITFLCETWRAFLGGSAWVAKLQRMAFVVCVVQVGALGSCTIWSVYGDFDDATATLSVISAVNFLLLLLPLLGFATELHKLLLDRQHSKFGVSRWVRLMHVFQNCFTLCRKKADPSDLAAIGVSRMSVQAVVVSCSVVVRTMAAIADAYRALNQKDLQRYISNDTGVQVLYGIYFFIADFLPVACIVIFTMNEPWRSYFLAKPLWRALGCDDEVRICCCFDRKPRPELGIESIDPTLLLSKPYTGPITPTASVPSTAPQAVPGRSSSPRRSHSSVCEDEFDVVVPSSSYMSSSYNPRPSAGMLTVPPSPARLAWSKPVPVAPPQLGSSLNSSSFTSQFMLGGNGSFNPSGSLLTPSSNFTLNHSQTSSK